jgi:succinate-semialdehyde dehydrogenase/glutarate-semialdehyde dehydrogenase
VNPAERVYRTVNPATGDVVREYPRLGDEEALALLGRAHDAFLAWREVPISRRVQLFDELAGLIKENADRLAREVTLEMGKPLAQAAWEADVAANMFSYYAANGEELLADENVTVADFSSVVVRREPMGVVLGIEPWNGPLYQAMRVAAPNLMLGNTVLVKPAETSAGSTLLLDELFVRAGFPSDVYQTALLSTDQVSSLIADPRVRAITLTGSDRAGAAIGEQAGRHIKPVILELGGSDAFIVLDDADAATAAVTAATWRCMLSGQVCNAPKRVIVTDGVADAFIEQFADVFASQKLGDPFDPETTMGPLSSDAAVDKLEQQYQDAIDKGATVVVPGGRLDGPGSFFKPAVITDITPEMRVYSEEVFGPIGMVYRVADAAAAVELANSSQYGLGGAVFSQDVDEARRVAGLLDTGGVGINKVLGAPIETPFGGTKSSGVGRELGRSGMDQFANIKTYGFA